jgi:hypothetical protein
LIEGEDCFSMSVRYFALILGILYLLIGIMGLVPGLIQPPAVDQGVAINLLYGDLLGIFPVNIVHTLVHLIVGISGLLAYRDFDASRTFAKTIGIVFAVLFLMGVVPGLNTMFGMAPLYGADIWLHLLTSLFGLYFGFVAARFAAERITG